MLWTAGFDRVVERSRFEMRSTHGFSVRHVVHHASESHTVETPPTVPAREMSTR
jgi:hypothetical protein